MEELTNIQNYTKKKLDKLLSFIILGKFYFLDLSLKKVKLETGIIEILSHL